MKIARLLPFLLTLILPGVGLWKLSSLWDYRLLAGYVLLVSLTGYVACFQDKRKAIRGAWRTPESTLHFIELAGGWFGSFVAQRRYRHKTSKGSYQVMFWLIVFLHQAFALDFLLDWRFVHWLTQTAGG